MFGKGKHYPGLRILVLQKISDEGLILTSDLLSFVRTKGYDIDLKAFTKRLFIMSENGFMKCKPFNGKLYWSDKNHELSNKTSN